MPIAPDPRTAEEWARGISAVRGAADARARGRGRSDAGTRGFPDTSGCEDIRQFGSRMAGFQGSPGQWIPR
eukprot:gene15356-biopygen4101